MRSPRLQGSRAWRPRSERTAPAREARRSGPEAQPRDRLAGRSIGLDKAESTEESHERRSRREDCGGRASDPADRSQPGRGRGGVRLHAGDYPARTPIAPGLADQVAASPADARVPRGLASGRCLCVLGRSVGPAATRRVAVRRRRPCAARQCSAAVAPACALCVLCARPARSDPLEGSAQPSRRDGAARNARRRMSRLLRSDQPL
jgi:hypothetical protein